MMIFYLTAKLGISASYLIIYPFAGELYPTEVRGLGLGFSAYIGGIGLCCIPLINYLVRVSLLFTFSSFLHTQKKLQKVSLIPLVSFFLISHLFLSFVPVH